MSQIEEQMVELGYQIFAVTPSLPAKNKQTLEEAGYHYTLLSDPELRIAAEFGLVWHVSDETVKRYVDYGIDLEKDSGQEHHNLPVPAAYLIGADGKVDFAYVNPDHTTRVSSEVLLAAARAALQ